MRDVVVERNDASSDLTRQGIDLLKKGDKERARQVLAAAILENRDDLQAWLWLSGAVETDAERAACLQQVLRIDPLNSAALRGLALLEKRHKNGSLKPLVPPENGPTVQAAPPAGNGHPDLEPTRQIRPVGPFEGQALESTLPVRAEPPVTEPVQPVPIQPPAPAGGQAPADATQPASAQSVTAAAAPERSLFRLRPSLLPAILGGAVFILVLAMALAVVSGHPLVQYLVLLPAALIGIKTVVTQFAERLNEVYTLTTERVRIKSGALRSQNREILLSSVSRVECRRGVLGFLLGTSNLLLYDADGKVALRLRDLSRCGRRVEQIAQAAGLVVGKE